MSGRPLDLHTWLDAQADALDREAATSGSILPALCAAGVFEAGVPRGLGGAGGDITDAVDAIATVSRSSLAAGFVAWGHRTFIEYLLQSTNTALREARLPALLSGTLAGATGLSNAMKFLSGLEGLQIEATPTDGGFRLSGKLPWVTNLKPEGFIVAAAATEANSGCVLVMAVPSDAPGVMRSPDLDLMAMRASNTAAVDLVDVPLDASCLLTSEARTWLPRVRPAFLGLQCGMSVGLARRALDEARVACGAGRHILRDPIADLSAELERRVAELHAGLRSGGYVTQAARLFEVRIRLAEIAQEAVSLELHAAGGRAYLAQPGAGFQRRWREAAFVPIITPSLVQLKAALAARQAERAA